MSEPYVTLRLLAAEDIPALQAVYADSPAYFRIFHIDVAPDQAQKDFTSAQLEGRALLGLFDKQGEMVGALDMRMHYPTRGITHIGLLLVKESQRRQGIGSLAYRILEHWLQTDQQMEIIQVGVEATNLDALRFWKKQGFALTGAAERRLIGRKRARILTMQKTLSRRA